jgi:hypothetical protein
MRPVKTTMRKQSGIALITTLLLLMLMSAMVVGFILLVTEGQRLSGMNNDQSKSFYGAESGMEKLTADLGSLFGATYAPTGAQVDALTLTPPTISYTTGVNYVDAQGVSSYKITYPKDNNGNPRAQFAQITSGSSAFQGMTALETTYTLTVGARSTTGGETKLQRTTQTVGIPLFQFGIFSEFDLDYFPGPNFNFGGRVHSNGNLFLNSGGPAGATPNQVGTNQLWLANPVTAAGDILRDCLENTNPENAGSQHPGSVEITKGGGAFQLLDFGQGSLLGCLPAKKKNPAWPAITASFNSNLRSGVKPLNLTITLLGNGASQPIDMIRRPVRGEDANNPGVLGERYFAQASLRILLSDNANDITALPCVSPGAPFNLADLGLPVANWVSANAILLKGKMAGVNTIPLPLAASGAATNAPTYVQGYNPAPAPPTGFLGGDGYWQPGVVTGAGAQPATPVITGFIKIDAQTTYGNPCGAPVDVTQEILSLGYAGRNINPVPQSLDGATLNANWSATLAKMEQGQAPALPILPPRDNGGAIVQLNTQGGPAFVNGAVPFDTTLFNKGNCPDPHPNAVIRLERLRDNPSSLNVQVTPTGKNPPPASPVQSTVAEVCGVDPATGNLTKLRTGPTAAPATGPVWIPNPSDFWPNTLFDTREGTIRDVTPAAPFDQRVRLGGVMHYIELDVNNLARWFSGAIGATGPATRDPNVAPNNFVVYVSDRRGNYAQGGVLGPWPPLSPTGNETGEYGFTDFVNPLDVNGCPNNALDNGEDLDRLGAATGFFKYGQVAFPPALVDSTGKVTANTLFPNSLTATAPDAFCGAGPNGGAPWPGTFLVNSNEARENPSALFRRAVKLVNGRQITLPLCPGAITCGLTIATENPAYIQGDYNANSVNGGFADPNVAASVAADALTLLSVSWNDVNSFAFPYNTNRRNGATTWYRLGVVAGVSQYFPIPPWNTPALNGSQDFGTDGGVHNFLRYVENWGGSTLNYQGSIVSMYYNRQAIGLFKCCNTIYQPPTRGYQFDANFLNPTLLPPRTPMFRDVNTTGFTQLLLPTQ